MGRWLYWVICLMFSTAEQAQDPDPARVVCYQPHNQINEEFLLGIPCTHLVYSHARIDAENNSVSLDLSASAVIVTKERLQSRVDTLIQIGGDEDKNEFSQVTSNPSRRRQFIQSITSLTKKYSHVKGVDLYWMNPSKSQPHELRNYVSLVQELRKEYPGTISMWLPNMRNSINSGFNLPLLNTVVDVFILPAYNFTVDAPPNTYHPSPLYHPPGSNIPYNSLLSMTKLYLQLGIVPEKLILGIPLFGRLVNNDTMKIEDHQLPNNQICLKEAEEGWTKEGDSMTGPVLMKGNQIIYYDTPASITEKAKLAKELKLGGVMFWSMDMDLRNKRCQKKSKNEKWSNIAAAYKELLNKNYVIIEAYSLDIEEEPSNPLIKPSTGKPPELKPLQTILPEVTSTVVEPLAVKQPGGKPSLVKLLAAKPPAVEPSLVEPLTVKPPVIKPSVTEPFGINTNEVKQSIVKISQAASDNPQPHYNSASENSNGEYKAPTIYVNQSESAPFIKITIDDQDIIIENSRVLIKKKTSVIEIDLGKRDGTKISV